MLKVYNTLLRKKELFKPRKGKSVNLFVCGPTVYDSAHLGHGRTYLFFDLLAKYLKENGYNVFYLQNITDIDDKIIQRAKEKGITTKKLARQFEKEYLNDMHSLGIDSIAKYARATQHLKEIKSQVQRLLKKGYAYEIEDGIYFDVAKFKDYGKLSGRTILQAEDAVSRIDDAKEKRNKGDFCLWKGSLGKGRPGWHIEDTAIAEKYFGVQYDIHGGAQDLIFPHHEAEIAQMEALSDQKPFVRYWLHTGFLKVNGQKMAKSLGNFITIRDFTEKHSPRLLRFLILKNHYRSPVDYNESAVSQAEKELARIDEFIDNLRRSDLPKLPYRNIRRSDLPKFQTCFDAVMTDDFNTPQALAVIFNLINQGNTLIVQNKLSQKEAKEILAFFKKIDRFFNFIFWPKSTKKIPQEILNLVKQREECRKTGNWQKADESRQKIKKLGWRVEDTKSGPKVKKI